VPLHAQIIYIRLNLVKCIIVPLHSE